MNDADRTMAAAITGLCFATIVGVALYHMPVGPGTGPPYVLLILFPTVALTWIALHNIGKRP